MSTTIGIGNIVGPIIALGYGGPGTLVGFVLGTLLGSATTFTEVVLSIMYRSQRTDGSTAGGPMEYLKKELGNSWAWLYAFFGSMLLIAWSMSQSNTLAILLSKNNISPLYSGIFLAISILFILLRGVSLIGKISNVLVPVMFIVYSITTGLIIIKNIHKLPEILSLIGTSFFSPKTAIAGSAGFGLSQMIRWGFARAVQTNEIGTGTSTFPHSITSGNAQNQAALATVAVYTNGILCILSSLTLLTSDLWQQAHAIFDINLFNAILVQNYGNIGNIILTLCACMFAFGTILGNCYNGSQCFLYITKNRWLFSYYFIAALFVFWGALSKVSFVWSIADYFVIPVAIPHIIGLLIIAWKKPSIFELNK
jgi:AGCS family alanine or glycine:cation symporter